jgi:hypothetical protein
MMKGFTQALKGISGDYELNRLVGFFGGIVYVIGAHAFVAYHVIWLGNDFDVTAYCLAFPGGLAVVAGGTAAAVSLKDRNVASAKVISQTGAVPTPAIDGAKVPTGDPPPVEDVHTASAAPAEELPEYAR